ncbi:hypothetical protein EBT11_08620, partial [bacterium]|nr:hypothetical protein [bacterium]
SISSSKQIACIDARITRGGSLLTGHWICWEHWTDWRSSISRKKLIGIQDRFGGCADVNRLRRNTRTPNKKKGEKKYVSNLIHQNRSCPLVGRTKVIFGLSSAFGTDASTTSSLLLTD